MFGRIQVATVLCAGLAAVGSGGCESPSWTHKLNESFRSVSDDGSPPRTPDDHRREYAANRSIKSLRWLLSHEVQVGMTFREVCNKLGEEGEREPNDRSLKKTAEYLRIDDETYGWPDSEGHIVYLFFRDGRLIHFNPEEFRGA